MSHTNSAVVGHAPGPTVKTTLHCVGCSALHTTDWSFVEENDGLDTGIDAKCTAMDPAKHISSYWCSTDRAPSWCPAQPLATGATNDQQ